MARLTKKKSMKAKQPAAKRSKRSMAKSKKVIAGAALVVFPQISKFAEGLKQNLQKQATQMQKQVQKLEPKVNKRKAQQEKMTARLKAAQEKMASAEGSATAKKQLKSLSSKADKAGKDLAAWEKEYIVAQLELESVQKEQAKLTALQDFMKQYDKGRETNVNAKAQKNKVNERREAVLQEFAFAEHEEEPMAT